MRVVFVFAVSAAAVAGCAASQPTARLAAPDPSTPALAASIELSNVREVAIESFVETMVCRREAPTGSRISVERCYPKDPANQALEAALQQQTRDELDELRRQHMHQEQARQQAAREAAVRQRLGF